MKTARLIARFLRTQAAAVRRQCFGECLMSLAMGIGVLLFQYAYYFLAIWFCVCFQGGEALAIALVIALLPIALQFIAYAAAGADYFQPASTLVASPSSRLLFGGFLLVGPQILHSAIQALRKAWRVSFSDFDNCANVVYVMMTGPDVITIEQAGEAVSIRQSVNTVLGQLRLFPGVVVRPSGLRLTPGLRAEVAEFCRSEKERIRETVSVDEAEAW